MKGKSGFSSENSLIINKQLRKLYMEQKRKKKINEKRRRKLERWKYICCCA